MNELVIVAVVLCLGWGVWGWLMWSNARRAADLERRVDELESKR